MNKRLAKLQKELDDANKDFEDIVEEKDKYYNMYNELKLCKDKVSIEKLEKDFVLIDEYNHFIKNANKVGSLINKCSPPVQSIIYYTLTSQDMTLSSDNVKAYSQVLKEACASQMIDEDETLNFQHPVIKKLLLLGKI